MAAAVWFRVILKIVMLILFIMSIVIIAVSSITIVAVMKSNVDNNSTTKEGEPKEIHWKEKVLPKFKQIEGEYKAVLLVSLVSVIAAGILEMLASLLTLLSCSREVRGKLKCNMVISLVVFVILLICVAAPLAFDSNKGQIRHLHEFRQSVETKFDLFNEKHFAETVMHELNAVFIAVGLYNAYLLVIMIFFSVSLCCKCGDRNYYPM